MALLDELGIESDSCRLLDGRADSPINLETSSRSCHGVSALRYSSIL